MFKSIIYIQECFSNFTYHHVTTTKNNHSLKEKTYNRRLYHLTMTGVKKKVAVLVFFILVLLVKVKYCMGYY